jgi:hypothetical protein
VETEINRDKIVEVTAYRCWAGHILIDAEGPDIDTVQALRDEMKREPRIKILKGSRGIHVALGLLGLPKRIKDTHVWGETTIGSFLDVSKKHPAS